MTKPKNDRAKFMAQHKRILEERTELLAKLEGFEKEKLEAVRVAVGPFQAQAQEEYERAERYLAVTGILEDDIATLRTTLAGVNAALEDQKADHATQEAAWATEKAEIQAQLAASAPAIARLEELVERWKDRARKDEYVEANALLNRKTMAAAVPSPNRRG